MGYSMLKFYTKNLHTVIRFQVFRFNNHFQTDLFDGTITNIFSAAQCDPKSNGNEQVLHTPQSSRTRASSLDTKSSYNQDTHFFLNGEGVLLIHWGYGQSIQM